MTPKWSAFGLWAVAGAVFTFAVLDITSIGFYLLPVGVLLVLVIVRSVGAPLFPDIFGLVPGVAAILLWGAYISHGVPRCQPGVALTAVVSGQPGDAVTATSGCTRIDSDAWLMRGVAVGAAGLIAHLIARMLARREARAVR